MALHEFAMHRYFPLPSEADAPVRSASDSSVRASAPVSLTSPPQHHLPPTRHWKDNAANWTPVHLARHCCPLWGHFAIFSAAGGGENLLPASFSFTEELLNTYVMPATVLPPALYIAVKLSLLRPHHSPASPHFKIPQLEHCLRPWLLTSFLPLRAALRARRSKIFKETPRTTMTQRTG